MWDKISNAIGNHFTKGQPNVPENIIRGNPWNLNTKFGGLKSPLPTTTKLGTMPKNEQVKMPKAVPYKQPPRPKVKAQNIATQVGGTIADLPSYVMSPLPNKAYADAPARPQARPTAVPSPTPAPDAYEATTMQTFDNYKIPREVAYGIAAAEKGKKNRFNIGAFDSNPNNAQFQEDLPNATSAAKMLSGQAEPSFYGNGAKGKKQFADAYAKRASPAAMLRAIQDAGYAGDPKTWKARSTSQGGAGKYFNSWDEFIKNTPAYKKWSKK